MKRQNTGILDSVRSEIRTGHPVIAYFNDILAIKIVRNGHAAVVDGYARQGNETFVHVNFGWGGKSDGWYNFNRLSAGRKLLYIFTIRT